MRLSVTLPDALYRRVQRQARTEGRSGPAPCDVGPGVLAAATRCVCCNRDSRLA
jgi:hypothetical protein